MSIIEQAERRLEELRRSGIEIPASAGIKSAPAAAPLPAPADANSVPARAARKLVELRPVDSSPMPLAAPAAPSVPDTAAAPAEEAATVASKPVQIDLARLAGMGYLTPETPRAQIGDEFRLIKRPLLKNIDGKGSVAVERANLIMVTSSLPGEGKTFVAVNLAISIAMELDKTVLLVDADVSRPSVLSRLGLESSRGLLDVLTVHNLSMPEVLLRTNIDKLSILPAGTPNGRATELLASESMNDLLDELAARYADRVIVFDTPPLLLSTESRVLATHMGQVVLVVEAEQTTHDTVKHALTAIEACPVVLPMLNKTAQSDAAFYYGYYGPVQG
jgi:receptor protein-tyrosine kinase